MKYNAVTQNLETFEHGMSRDGRQFQNAFLICAEPQRVEGKEGGGGGAAFTTTKVVT